ncbi:hypothetical protein HY485_05160 [Candidatus Woesearchaeota archaeon]|nr:hypothetical protein [Candidatus Woesearchaeota archaeon]
MSKHTLVASLKEIGVIHHGTVNLSHAGQSDIYFNIKKAYGHPGALNIICEALWSLILKHTPYGPTCLAAIGYGGITPASVLSQQHYRNLILVRNELKQHGLQQHIEGYKPNNTDLVAIIDDVCTTSGTLQKAVDIIQQTGARVTGCYVVLKRGEGKLSVPLRYILTPEDLL